MAGAHVTRCPHGAGPAAACSQCIGAAVRHVTLTPDGVVEVDTAPTRVAGEEHRTDAYARAKHRGGRNWHSRGKPRTT